MEKFIITPPEKLEGEITVPGDKSISHRAVMIGSIAKGDTIIENFLRSDDCYHTIDCFKKMGIEIEEGEQIKVKGKGLNGLREPHDVLDVGNSGTTMRLLMGILAGQKFHATVTGDQSIRRRPMGRVVDPLKRMGAKIHGRQKDTLAPLTIFGGKLNPINYELPVASAQVKSAILFAGLYASGPTTVIEKKISRDHTERMLEHFGAKIEREDGKITVKERSDLAAQTISVPGDISSAAFLIVAACITPNSKILIRNVGVNPGRIGIIEILHRMDANIEVINERMISNEPVADISVRSSELRPITIDGDIVPKIIDEIPIIALAASQAKGETTIRGAEELRFKESDRIKTMVKELKRLGVDVDELRDGMKIRGKAKLKSCICQSYGDHRIAMVGAVAGLIASGGTTVEKTECIETSFPEFPSFINKLAKKECIEVLPLN
ncbi:3-phosphoshikimate 1-carboxyvinyltransferase [Candidatus Margulisiibacteriota bacterium]